MNNNIDNEFVKKLRSNLSLSQSELANRLGVSARTIQNWEGGKRNIPELAKEALRKLSNGDTKKEEICLTKDGVNIKMSEVLHFVVENEEEALKYKIFSNIIEVKTAKRILEITTSKEKLLDYLNS